MLGKISLVQNYNNICIHCSAKFVWIAEHNPKSKARYYILLAFQCYESCFKTCIVCTLCALFCTNCVLIFKAWGRNFEIKEHKKIDKALQVTVDFVAEIITCIRDKEKKIISGDPDKIKKIYDTWVFSRDSRSNNPNWQLVDTLT